MGNGRSGSGMWNGRSRNTDGVSDPYGEDEGVVADGNPTARVSPSDAALHWRDTALDRPVGPMPYAPNLGADVAKVQRLMSGAGRYDAAGHEEQGGIYSDGLEAAIRTYQRDRGLADDGTLMPNGPTVASLKRDLFGRGRAGTGEAAQAGPHDLRPRTRRDTDVRNRADDDTGRFMRVSDPGDEKRPRHPNLLLDRGDDASPDDARDAPKPHRRDADRRHTNLLLEGEDRDDRRPKQLAQNDPDNRNEANPWGNAGDVRRKDNDDLMRTGYGPGVWLPDRSNPNSDNFVRYHPQTLQPLLDSRGAPIRKARADLEADSRIEGYRPYFTWSEWARLNFTEAELNLMGNSPRKMINPVAPGTLRGDIAGDGWKDALRNRKSGIGTHNGIDLEAPEGSPVVSPISGEIFITRGLNDASSAVSIRGTGDFNGVWILLEYAIPAAGIVAGAPVRVGDVVGKMDRTTRSYPGEVGRMTNHLHFDVKIGRDWDSARYVDPLAFLDVKRVFVEP